MSESHAKGGSRRKPMTVATAASMGIGSMVGAGVFALMGEAGLLAGSAVFLSFLAGGVITLFSGYSFAKLGVRYRSAGGLVDYLVEGYGVGYVSGSLSMLYLITLPIGMALVAKAFGSYAAALFIGPDAPGIWVNVFASLAMVLVTAVNFSGARGVGRTETIIVAVKLLILTLLVIAGVVTLKPELLAPSTYPRPIRVLGSLALTFFAYTGFQVINNTVEDMPDPKRTLPRAMTLTVLLVMGLYVAVAIVTFGNLTPAEAAAAKDTALAVAARPLLGQAGFTIVSIAALLATSSGINASLYGTANVAYVLAQRGELPEVVEHRVWQGGTTGLLLIAGVVLLLANTLDLTTIAGLGSVTTLVVYFLVNVGHLRILEETEASRTVVLLGVITAFIAIGLYAGYSVRHRTGTLWMLVIAVGLAFALEALIQRATGRKILPRRLHRAKRRK